MTVCPKRSTLERLAVGRLADDELTACLEEHVQFCAACAETLQSLSTDDSIVAEIHSIAVSHYESDYHEEISQLIDLLCKKPIPALTDDPNSAPPDRVNGVLAPAHEQGELGWMGPFRVDDVIATGGMGVVLRGVDPHLQRTIAIKIMKPSLANTPYARARFLREARAMATLEHDHIVTIHQVGEQGGTPYFVMPLLRGVSLSERLRHCKTLAPEDVMRIGLQIASGLAVAHRQSVLHRDIKPSNVWLEAGTDRVKLLDFGLTSVTNSASDCNESPLAIGTPGYMSPEQAEGGRVDQRSDLFGLGCLIYEACSGKPPFHDPDRRETIEATMRCEPKPLLEAAAKVTPQFSLIVMTLLQKDPSKRIQTAAELVDKLKSILHQTAGSSPKSILRRKTLWGFLAGIVLGSFSLWLAIHNQSATIDNTPEPVAVVRPTAHLFTMDSDGGNLTQITASSEYQRFSSPDWSPDGTLLAFDGWSRERNSTAHVLIVRTDTHDVRDLGIGMMPNFSPEGHRIAFSWPDRGIGTMNADGEERRLIAADGWGAQWSPDGKWIACEIRDPASKTAHIALIDVETGERNSIFSQNQSSHYSRIFWNMEWSPDSNQICFRAVVKETGKIEFAIASINGSNNIVALRPGGNIYSDFSWHPDGESILFAMTTRKHTGQRLYVYNLREGSTELFDHQPTDCVNTSGVWSADARRIAFTSRREVPN